MDPRIKLLLVLLFTVIVFLVDSLLIAFSQMVLFVVLCLIARIPMNKIFPHWKFLLFLAAFVIAMQTLFAHDAGGGYLLKPLIPDGVPLLGGTGSLKRDGFFTGLMVCCRIVSLTVILPLLTTTTDARRLAFGITKLGLNYKAAYTITSTLNLIPSFEEETRLIMEARTLRGVRNENKRSLFSRLYEYRALGIPLLIKAMRKAQIISLAMDARAFGVYRTRTWALEAKMKAGDFFALFLGMVFSAAIVAANMYVAR